MNPTPSCSQSGSESPSPAPRARFRPHERVRHPEDYRRAFDRKRSVSDAQLVIHAVENGLGYARLGISLSRKRVRRATGRNRIKRILREAFRLCRPELPTGIDLVVVPRGGPLTLAKARASLVRLAWDAARRLGTMPPRSNRPGAGS